MTDKALEVFDLTKVYASTGVVANDHLTFSVEAGRIFGLLGPNGAGKSTLVKQLVGLLTPTSGRVHLFGEEVKLGRRELRVAAAVAYLPQGLPALGELTVEEAVAGVAVLRGREPAQARAQAAELCGTLELGDLRERQLRRLSGGQRRLAQIAMTLAGDLPVLILDEPTADIDPRLKRVVWELVAGRARAGATVILVTHDVSEAEHVLDRVAIIDRGRFVAAGTPAELKARLADRTRIEIVVAEGASVAADSVARDLGPHARVAGRRISAWVAADDAVRILEKAIQSVGLDALEDVHLVTPTLEDVYLEVGAAR